MKNPCSITDCKGQVLKPGDVLRYNQHDRHIVKLRDAYLNEGRPSDRAMKKKWHDDALNARFRCVEIYNNGHCDGLEYVALDPVTGADLPGAGSCMGHVMEKA